MDLWGILLTFEIVNALLNALSALSNIMQPVMMLQISMIIFKSKDLWKEIWA